MTGIFGCLDVNALMQKCMDNDFEFVTLLDADGVPNEGTLGYGHFVMLAPPNTPTCRWWNFEVTEVYLNEWSSGHKIRRFHKVSKALQKEIDRAREVGMGVPV